MSGPFRGGSAAEPETQSRARISILEGMTVQPTPPVAGADFEPDKRMRAVIQGPQGAIRFDDALLSKHTLFLGGVGTGKTNAMMQLIQALRASATNDDVFVVFDTKGDFLDQFYAPGDAVISSQPTAQPGGVVWNLFSDIAVGDADARSDEIFEVASTVFGDDLQRAAQNYFFTAGARDLFTSVVEILTRDGAAHSNADLRTTLELSNKELYELIKGEPDLAGTLRYLQGTGTTPDSVRAFLQQTVNSAFSSAFRLPGDFSIRQFIRAKSARAVFVEYDIAIGSRLLPVYRVLIDMAIKEALSLGRSGVPGNVFFVMDEFALLPLLSHLSDGINFGRSLGIKFIVGTQNVDQVLYAYGPELGRTILSGFGSLFAFRLMDNASRDLVRQRFGSNRKQVTTELAVRSQGIHQEVVLGNVIEDWVLSSLTIGNCVVSIPEWPPFYFAFREFG